MFKELVKILNRTLNKSLLLFFLLFFLLCLYSCSAYCGNALRDASKFRNLEILNNSNCEVVSKEGFESILKESAPEPNLLEKEEIAYKMTGFIPETYDYSKCFAENSADEVFASYFPSNKKIYIPNDYDKGLLVHESVHALQDQHFNLNKLSNKYSVSTDSYLAFSSIVEGDAELVQREYEKENKVKRKSIESIKTQKSEEEQVCKTPESINFQLDFPYFWGARYLSDLSIRDQAFSNIPKYTTQVLYPKTKEFNFKPVSKKEVIDFALKYSANIEEPIYEDSWGEYTLRCLLRDILGSTKAIIGARGWAGDRILVFKTKQEDYLTAWIINLETKKDTGELFNALLETLERRFKVDLDKDRDKARFSSELYSEIFLERELNRVKFLVRD